MRNTKDRLKIQAVFCCRILNFKQSTVLEINITKQIDTAVAKSLVIL